MTSISGLGNSFPSLTRFMPSSTVAKGAICAALLVLANTDKAEAVNPIAAAAMLINPVFGSIVFAVSVLLAGKVIADKVSPVLGPVPADLHLPQIWAVLG